MVYLRSGRFTGGEVELCLSVFPTVPSGGFIIRYPMRVGRFTFSDTTSSNSKDNHLAIVGLTTTCVGQGVDPVGAGDDAVFKLDGYMEDDKIANKANCRSFFDDPFHIERELLRTGMQWQGPVADCDVFLIVSQGKVVSFGWQKKGDEKWRVFEEPKLQSLH